jgi:hypothetical protein
MNERMSFEAWLAALERQIARLPTLHGPLHDVKAELGRLAAYARRAGRGEGPDADTAPVDAADTTQGAADAAAPEQGGGK